MSTAALVLVTTNYSAAFIAVVAVATAAISIASMVTAVSSSAIVLVTALIATATAGSGTSNVDISILVMLAIFMFVFPLGNAVFDWLSWAATRYFLKAIKRDQSVWMLAVHILTDLAVAVVCILGLAIVLPFTTELTVNLLSIPFDWRQWISNSLANPFPDGIPLFFMLATTLIPTAIHVTAGLGAIFSSQSSLSMRAAELIPQNAGDPFDVGMKIEARNMILKSRRWYIPAAFLTLIFVPGGAIIMLTILDRLGINPLDLAYWSGDVAVALLK